MGYPIPCLAGIISQPIQIRVYTHHGDIKKTNMGYPTLINFHGIANSTCLFFVNYMGVRIYIYNVYIYIMYIYNVYIYIYIMYIYIYIL